LTVSTVDIAIIGAGPYGLSLAAHLRNSNRSVRIFGSPMSSWSNHMPQGMHLKSEGFASNLYDPAGEFTLEKYCAERAIPYADIGLPVAIETFIAYGLEFQRRYVPNLENVQVNSLKKTAGGFELTTAAGEAVRARQVVVAAGIVNFAYLPPALSSVPSSMISHSSKHSDLSQFKGRKVAVLGAGASAVDIAALLLGAGAEVELIARREKIDFNDPPIEPRSFLQRLKAPRSGLGTGWRSRLCSDIPLVFHAMPESLRIRAVARHLGPAPCWFVRDTVANRVPMHLGTEVTRVESAEGRARLVYKQNGGPEKAVEADHVIAATGYKPAVSRLTFIDQSVQSAIRKATGAPVLNRQFESSVEGLYFIGIAAANSFGPLLRFAFGARFAAERMAARLAA
jgi:cation diffusion facilitator CzcD-associated flavoprotein CzcO